jgi:N-acetylneuraminate synthase/N,N'-diacetyllegionaminate synthase
MEKIKIGNKLIGDGEPCYIIAEAGRNHNGNIRLAKKLVEMAAECGADAVKFQSFRADDLIVRDVEKIAHIKERIKESAYESTKKVELKEQWHFELADLAKENNIDFLSTPEDHKMADLLERVGVPAFKIASLDITYFDLLRHVAKKGKPMIVSTGMSNLAEVAEAVEVIRSESNNQIILLHCVSAYPPSIEDVNLSCIKMIKQVFNLPTGYSDHTLSIFVPVSAVALGANLIEKHFTLDKSLPGVDHKISADPKEFKKIVEGIREIEKAMGSGFKLPSASESEMRRKTRRKIVAQMDIRKGSIIKRDMLGVKIAGEGGLEPKFLDVIIGRRLKVDVKKDQKITWDMI